jgi:outer membrane protein OmpA-like peptidoglycan-associated protein
MAEPNDHEGGAPSHIHFHKDRKLNWLPWLLLGLGLLALLLALSRCNRDETAAVAPAVVPVPDAEAVPPSEVVAATANAGQSDALVATSELGTYLAGTESLPRTFTFEKLNFDTAKSDIRAADASEVNNVAATLSKYPTAKIRIAGYADARGKDAANMALGKARADSVKNTLVAKGVDAALIGTVSGGETDPVDTNATAAGRFENPRTELVVTAR